MGKRSRLIHPIPIAFNEAISIAALGLGVLIAAMIRAQEHMVMRPTVH